MRTAKRLEGTHFASRSNLFQPVQPRHLDWFSSLLARPCLSTGRVGKLITDREAVEPFATEWLKQKSEKCPAVLQPVSTEQVAEIIRYCSKEKLSLVPQSGNTGLTFGSIPIHDEMILSLARMNAEPVVNRDSMNVVSESGVILQLLQKKAQEAQLLFPLSMGSKGSAMIGGCVSTNAGGIHYARYGSLHGNTLGLEVVTGEGEVLNLMSSLRKDNTGYDLKHLFIGSEGTLGVVTKVCIKLYPFPQSQQLALFHVPDIESVLSLYHLANRHLGECLSAFEVMDGESLSPMPDSDLPYKKTEKSNTFRTSNDFRAAYFCVLIETNGSSSNHDFEKLSDFVESAQNVLPKAFGEGYLPILSESTAQTEKLWKMREEVPLRLNTSGTIWKFDFSFPIDKFYISVEFLRELLYKKHRFNPDEVLVAGYGHFGDGNVHLSVVDKTRQHSEKLNEILIPTAYEFCVANAGSISAEHGIGARKKDYLSFSRSPETLKAMRKLKYLFDPSNILNPYKVLP